MKRSKNPPSFSDYLAYDYRYSLFSFYFLVLVSVLHYPWYQKVWRFPLQSYQSLVLIQSASTEYVQYHLEHTLKRRRQVGLMYNRQNQS